MRYTCIWTEVKNTLNGMHINISDEKRNVCHMCWLFRMHWLSIENAGRNALIVLKSLRDGRQDRLEYGL